MDIKIQSVRTILVILILLLSISIIITTQYFPTSPPLAEGQPKEPHWYLPLLGVDPFFHGKGLGSALLQHALIKCDQDNTFAYLESSNLQNISLYKRHGFELLGTIQVKESTFTYPMLREPHNL